jgi:hypothetical protein
MGKIEDKFVKCIFLFKTLVAVDQYKKGAHQCKTYIIVGSKGNSKNQRYAYAPYHFKGIGSSKDKYKYHIKKHFSNNLKFNKSQNYEIEQEKNSFKKIHSSDYRSIDKKCEKMCNTHDNHAARIRCENKSYAYKI